MNKHREEFEAGDFVSFHTQYGRTTGMIEYIELPTVGKRFQYAVITVTFPNFKKKHYRRPLFKLRKVI